jgi:hypothetical protein
MPEESSSGEKSPDARREAREQLLAYAVSEFKDAADAAMVDVQALVSEAQILCGPDRLQEMLETIQPADAEVSEANATQAQQDYSASETRRRREIFRTMQKLGATLPEEVPFPEFCKHVQAAGEVSREAKSKMLSMALQEPREKVTELLRKKGGVNALYLARAEIMFIESILGQ